MYIVKTKRKTKGGIVHRFELRESVREPGKRTPTAKTLVYLGTISESDWRLQPFDAQKRLVADIRLNLAKNGITRTKAIEQLVLKRLQKI